MECTISVPTTINEESSRHNSLVPPIKPSPSPSINAISEANESVECNEYESETNHNAFNLNHPTACSYSDAEENDDSSDTPNVNIPLDIFTSNTLLPPATVV